MMVSYIGLGSFIHQMSQIIYLQHLKLAWLGRKKVFLFLGDGLKFRV